MLCGSCALDRYGVAPSTVFLAQLAAPELAEAAAPVPLAPRRVSTLSGSPARRDFPGARELIDFERTSPTHPASKANAVRREFGISLLRYHQLLFRVVRTPEGLAIDRETCLRVRREIAERQALREPVVRLRAVGAQL
jgi:hypothetical protein